MFLVEKGKQLLQLIKAVNPWALLIWTVYVGGVLLLIYALMQLVHAAEAKDRDSVKRALLAAAAAAVLLVLKPVAYSLGWI